MRATSMMLWLATVPVAALGIAATSPTRAPARAAEPEPEVRVVYVEVPAARREPTTIERIQALQLRDAAMAADAAEWRAWHEGSHAIWDLAGQAEALNAAADQLKGID